MLESVTFGPARPVPGTGVLAVKPPLPQHRSIVGNAEPQSLGLAAALTQLGPPCNADKVATLKAAIASGGYCINPGAIADGVIRFGGSDLS